jgi:hypothetical protein
MVDLSSRWDRFAGVFCTLLVITLMAGCQAVSAAEPNSSYLRDGVLVVSSTNLSFGTAVIGSSKQMTDSVTNTSRRSVTISSVTSSDPQFVVSGLTLPLTLAPRQSATFTVTFSPQVAGTPSGRLYITTGRYDSLVALSGKAVPQGTLMLSPSSLSFGNVGVGQSTAKTVTLTNSGGSGVTVTQASVSNAAFTISGLSLPVTLAANQAASFSVTFAPKLSGAVSGSITVNGNASLIMGAVAGASSSPSTAPITASLPVAGDGTTIAGQLGVAPAAVAFGSVLVGSTQSQSVTLTNSGGSSATISQATATGAGVRISGLTLPLTLASGQSSTFQVTFAPTSAGSVTGSLAIVSSASNANLALAITGTAVAPGALAVAPTSLGFGNVQVGSSQSQPATITNSGGTTVTITQATTAGAGFSITGLTLPLVLAPGQNSAFSVRFAPQASGSVNGSVAFTGSGASATLPLSGAGQAATTLGVNPASVSFGSVQVGTNQPQTITLNNGSSSAITITQASASGTGFSISGLSLPATLNAGQSASFTTTFAPTVAGSATGSIAITSTASNSSFSIPLSGTGVTTGTLAANPTSIAFGNVQVGSSQSHSQTLTNTGGSLLHISTATVTGAGFATSGLSVPTTLNAGQSLTFNVTFTPQSSGNASGSLALTADGSVSNLSVALSGSGASPGQLAVTPTTVNFGNVVVGATQNQSGTLTASGAGVTISSVSSTNSEFTLSGLSLPVNLNAGQTANFTLTFAPNASGSASGTITFASNATNPPVATSVSGTGTAPPQHSVSLGWTASTSTVAGYNVYRGSQSGGPYVAVNSGLDASTSYTDTSVQAGQTYYYVVTAVDGSGNESVYSNQAQAVIPTP